MFNRKHLTRDEVPEEFFEEYNVWHRFAQATFHLSLHKSGIRVDLKPEAKISDMNWVKSQLGGYNWDLVNMHLSQEHKIAMCAYWFSQLLIIVEKPDNTYEGKRPPTREWSRDEWMAQIRASGERDRKLEEERQEKIKSGEITLPDVNRPYEAWTIQDGSLMRWKTGRSKEAVQKSLDHAGYEEDEYKIAYCSTDHESSRAFI